MIRRGRWLLWNGDLYRVLQAEPLVVSNWSRPRIHWMLGWLYKLVGR